MTLQRSAAYGIAGWLFLGAAGLMITGCARPFEGVPGANLGLIARPSSSFAIGHEALAALQDGRDPEDSQDRSHGGFNIWNSAGTHWVQYDWDRPVRTDRMDVYWQDDGRRVLPPLSARLFYWSGDRFVPATLSSDIGFSSDQFNTVTFGEVDTQRLRFEFEVGETGAAGILEWKVYDSGNTPELPPATEAGPDRVVILGGWSHLHGAVKTLDRGEGKIPAPVWKKAAGPGRVEFENPRDLKTRARFHEPGSYVLELRAGRGSLMSSSQLTVKVEAPPPPAPLEPVSAGFHEITSPFWKARVKALIVNWIPHCIARISDPDLPEGGMNNILDAAAKLAGKPHGRHRGYVFSNAWIFNTIEAACLALMIDPGDDGDVRAAQDKIRATVEDWIPKILAAQEPDGYFQTAFTLPRERARDDAPLERWTRRGDHEGYVAGYFLEAAIAHHLLTGGKDTRLYDAARKLADCWVAHIGPAPKKEWYDGHQGMELALVRFGRFVNEVEKGDRGRPYIELARFLLDCRRDGAPYDQSHVPVVQQYEAVGHAVRASYSYAAMADIALEMNDIDYQSAAKSLWDNIVHKKYYVTGGIGSGESSEGFGLNYALRNNAYCESCSSCGMIFFQQRMNRLYKDAMFADLMEDTLYNALLGSVDLAGKNFYYQNPLDTRGPRYDWHVCPCCVGNIPRTLLSLPAWIYLKDGDNLYVNLFAGSSVDVGQIAGTSVRVVQETDYPWNGEVAVTLHPAEAAAFSLRIRIPDRNPSLLYRAEPEAGGFRSLAVNGKPATYEIDKGYAVLTREWRGGDRIDLQLPLIVQRVKADSRVAANVGRTALRYGPLVFAVERVDQDIDQILSHDSSLKPEWRSGFLGGTMVITGTWAGGSPFFAIPYYARANRETPVVRTSSDTALARASVPVSSIVWIRDK